MMKKIHVDIKKIDEDERVIEGYASTEEEDADGEIITSEAMSNAIPGFMKLPGGGNLREMHQPSAVGKIPQMSMEGKRTKIRAKIIDDNAWRKVKEKVYTGFSIGGRVLKQIGNVIEQLELAEISLVDRPANPGAMFTLVKIDSVEENELTAEDLINEIIPEAGRQARESILNNKEKPMADKDKELEKAKKKTSKKKQNAKSTKTEKEKTEVVVDEAKQTSKLNTDLEKVMSKLDSLTNRVEEVENLQSRVEEVENLQSDDRFEKVVANLDKVVDLVGNLKNEVQEIKDLPQPVKVKTVAVDKDESSELAQKQENNKKRARYEELMSKAMNAPLGKATFTEADKDEALRLKKELNS